MLNIYIWIVYFYADKLKVLKRMFLRSRIKSAYVAMLKLETFEDFGA